MPWWLEKQRSSILQSGKMFRGRDILTWGQGQIMRWISSVVFPVFYRIFMQLIKRPDRELVLQRNENLWLTAWLGSWVTFFAGDTTGRRHIRTQFSKLLPLHPADELSSLPVCQCLSQRFNIQTRYFRWRLFATTRFSLGVFCCFAYSKIRKLSRMRWPRFQHRNAQRIRTLWSFQMNVWMFWILFEKYAAPWMANYSMKILASVQSHWRVRCATGKFHLSINSVGRGWLWHQFSWLLGRG